MPGTLAVVARPDFGRGKGKVAHAAVSAVPRTHDGLKHWRLGVEFVQSWLATLPVFLVYLLVATVIGVESMGIPLPGEITLVGASLLAAQGVTNPWWVAVAATAGAITGDSIGYVAGRRGGRALLERLGRRFPTHFGPAHLARAERAFVNWGAWAVFFGRFVALLRIVAGPLAGALHVPYRRFLLANASGGFVWGFGTTVAIYLAGQAAEKWLKQFSWLALAGAVLFGLATTAYLRRRTRRSHAAIEAMSIEQANASTQ